MCGTVPETPAAGPLLRLRPPPCPLDDFCMCPRQWHRTPTTQETDGFQVKRPGDVSVRCTLLLMLDYQVGAPKHLLSFAAAASLYLQYYGVGSYIKSFGR